MRCCLALVVLAPACGFSGHAGLDGAAAGDGPTIDATGDAGESDAPLAADAFTGAAVRVNVGGTLYVAPDGTTWAADLVCDGGVFISPTAGINGTSDATLYVDQKYGSPLTCAVGALPAGVYDVTLGFAELYFGDDPCTGPASTRTFNVSIEGAVVAAPLDETGQGGGCAATGGPGHAFTAAFTTRIDDGALDLVMTSVTGNYAVLNALELVQTGP